jgi:hypothetical protein
MAKQMEHHLNVTVIVPDTFAITAGARSLQYAHLHVGTLGGSMEWHRTVQFGTVQACLLH